MKAKRNTQQQKQQFVKASITGDFFVGYIQGKENEVIKRIKFIQNKLQFYCKEVNKDIIKNYSLNKCGEDWKNDTYFFDQMQKFNIEFETIDNCEYVDQLECIFSKFIELDQKINYESEYVIKLDKYEIVQSFDVDFSKYKKYKKITLKDDNRPIYNNLSCKDNLIYTTNGYVLFFEDVNLPDFSIPFELIEKVKKIHKIKEKNIYAFEIDRKMYYCDVVLLNSRDIIPSELPFNFQIEKKVLLKFLNKKYLTVNFDFSNNIIFQENMDNNSSKKIKIDQNKINGCISFNTKNLIDLISSIDGDLLSFNFINNHKCSIINDNFLIMPCFSEYNNEFSFRDKPTESKPTEQIESKEAEQIETIEDEQIEHNKIIKFKKRKKPIIFEITNINDIILNESKQIESEQIEDEHTKQNKIICLKEEEKQEYKPNFILIGSNLPTKQANKINRVINFSSFLHFNKNFIRDIALLILFCFTLNSISSFNQKISIKQNVKIEKTMIKEVKKNKVCTSIKEVKEVKKTVKKCVKKHIKKKIKKDNIQFERLEARGVQLLDISFSV